MLNLHQVNYGTVFRNVTLVHSLQYVSNELLKICALGTLNLLLRTVLKIGLTFILYGATPNGFFGRTTNQSVYNGVCK